MRAALVVFVLAATASVALIPGPETVDAGCAARARASVQGRADAAFRLPAKMAECRVSPAPQLAHR